MTALAGLIRQHAGHDVALVLARSVHRRDDAFARLACRTCRSVLAETADADEVYVCADCDAEFSDGNARDDHFMSPACPSA